MQSEGRESTLCVSGVSSLVDNAVLVAVRIYVL